jgi:hypothetical protein
LPGDIQRERRVTAETERMLRDAFDS